MSSYTRQRFNIRPNIRFRDFSHFLILGQAAGISVQKSVIDYERPPLASEGTFDSSVRFLRKCQEARTSTRTADPSVNHRAEAAHSARPWPFRLQWNSSKENVNKILSNSFDFKRPVKGKRSIKPRLSDWRPATRSRDSSLSAEKKSVWHWNEGSWAAFMNDSGSYFPVFKRLMSVRVSRTSDKQAFKQSH